ncbi:uncharacterized protein FSUBG_8224 [Fusarium subglutinans]|uniref:Uncharacterized protein n=1 Tax=Gibberella subglutinans TaxID=42677 RepID=A0A8H5UXW7_GIBSU|nr:uncharacterized protein FSUBG_8224 [Fusarium subglutinans]KAF5601249.1 hypothetical protein FSUBG_8224 [Fusarium subglutinans]
MSVTREKQHLAICYGYILVAVAQISLAIVASTRHNDTTPYTATTAYKKAQRATRTASGMAFLLMAVQFYLSAIITLLGCPIIYIGWHPKVVAPPAEDNLELKNPSYKMDPASSNGPEDAGLV